VAGRFAPSVEVCMHACDVSDEHADCGHIAGTPVQAQASYNNACRNLGRFLGPIIVRMVGRSSSSGLPSTMFGPTCLGTLRPLNAYRSICALYF
jgi:hypothetical protein